MSGVTEIRVGHGPDNVLDYEGITELLAEVEAAIARGKPILFQGATEGRFFALLSIWHWPCCLRRSFAGLSPIFSVRGRVVFTAPVPVAVLAKGHAIGVGAILLLSADQALIAARAKLRFPETMLGLGLFADMAGMIGLRSTGRLAERMLMQAEPLTGIQAVTCGLADSLAEASPDHPEYLFVGIATGPSRLAWAQTRLLCRADVLHVPVGSARFFLPALGYISRGGHALIERWYGLAFVLSVLGLRGEIVMQPTVHMSESRHACS